MLPVTYALLAEMMPSRHRGWSLVLVGGLGAVGGYAAASLLAVWLEPIFSWRVLWLANLPSGLMLVALGAFIPESAKFLMARGRHDEARRVMARFGATVHRVAPDGPAAPHSPAATARPRAFGGKLFALGLTAICWGLVNFGLLLWLPVELIARGYSMEVASQLLAASALIALPTVFVVAWLYGAWSARKSVLLSIAITLLGLAGVLWLALTGGASPVLPVALLIVGSNGIIAMLLPYCAESFPLRIRGRATGVVAACSKLGGVLAQGLAIMAIIPTLGVSAMMIAGPMLLSLLLVARYGRETRGSDLRDLDPEGHVFDGSGL
ncbi:MFS transporter, partial [Sphingopyxis sp.]|uniref:MFS transporter n=1 Tax=Sphingopyxis sp. TaxID=1908224 RepID=UPI002ED87C31